MCLVHRSSVKPTIVVSRNRAREAGERRFSVEIAIELKGWIGLHPRADRKVRPTGNNYIFRPMRCSSLRACSIE